MSEKNKAIRRLHTLFLLSMDDLSQMDNCLYVMSLWKQIERGDRINNVTAGHKLFQVARQRRWIA